MSLASASSVGFEDTPSGRRGDDAGRAAVVRLGAEAVPYTLIRRSRRTIGFVVRPEGLVVHAPRRLGLTALEAALQAKAGWIVAKLAAQRARAAQPAAGRDDDWRDGGRLAYRGGWLGLRLDPTAARVAIVRGSATADVPERADRPDVLILPLPRDAAPARIEAAATAWRRAEALRVFGERCAHFAPALGVRPARLLLTTARTRWGSASVDGTIRLNLRLLARPPEQLDYVVVHELAHLHEMNHGPRFWGIVASVLPAHRALRRALREASALGD